MEIANIFYHSDVMCYNNANNKYTFNIRKIFYVYL